MVFRRGQKQAQEGTSRVRLEMTNKRVPPPQDHAICIDTMSIQYRYNIGTIEYPKTPKNTQEYPKVPKNTQKHPKILKNTRSTQKYLKVP